MARKAKIDQYHFSSRAAEQAAERRTARNYPDNTPMANSLLSLLDKAGVPTRRKSATASST